MKIIQTKQGEYAILHAPNGKLSEHAENRFFEAALRGSELIYADHHVVFSDGHAKHVKKPDWSPDTLLSVNYIESPFAVKRRLLPEWSENAMLRPEGRYELTLLLTECAKSIDHIRESLFCCPSETPCESSKPIEHALRRRKLHATVEPGMLRGSFAVRYPVRTDTRVSCIIYGHCGVQCFRKTLESIAVKNCWNRIEFIIADNGEIETAKERYHAALKQRNAARIFRAETTDNLSALINCAARNASGELLLFLEAGIQLKQYDAIERMMEISVQQHIYTTGGIVLGQDGEGKGIIHNAKSITGPMMVRKELFFAAGSFDETFEQTGFIEAFTQLCSVERYNAVTPYAAFCFRNQPHKTNIGEINQMRIKDLRSLEE